jgi:DNA polymerase III subunit gamma/tau
VSWDTEYRPRRFADVLGQDAAIKVLQAAITSGKGFRKSYLLWGPHGSGKTTLARIVAMSLLCKNFKEGEPCGTCVSCTEILESGRSISYHELDATRQGDADSVRKLVANLAYESVEQRNIYLYDEAHRLGKVATDALLKPMEDPLPGTSDKRLVTLLCTTDPASLRPAIKSRCLEFETRRPEREVLVARLQYICDQEKVEADPVALGMIVDHYDTHIRDMINFMEKVAHTGTISEETVRDLLRLGLRSQYMEVLLSLPDDPQKASDLMEQIFQEVDAQKAVEGLMQAATFSYLQGNSLATTRLTEKEKELASQVYEKHGELLLTAAERFTRFPYKAGKSAVLCELQIAAMLLSGRGLPTVAPVLVTTSPAETKTEQANTEPTTEPESKPEDRPAEQTAVRITDDMSADRFTRFSRAPTPQRRPRDADPKSKSASSNLNPNVPSPGEVSRHLNESMDGGWSAGSS